MNFGIHSVTDIHFITVIHIRLCKIAWTEGNLPLYRLYKVHRSCCLASRSTITMCIVHCRRKVRLSPNSATVAVVSPFSATVWKGFRLQLTSFYRAIQSAVMPQYRYVVCPSVCVCQSVCLSVTLHEPTLFIVESCASLT